MSKLTLSELQARFDEMQSTISYLTDRIDQLEGRQPVTTRNRGPKSERKMTEYDAWRIIYGDLKAVAVKNIAETLGLSRGQVYSVRGGYTFRYIKEDQVFSEADMNGEGQNDVQDMAPEVIEAEAAAEEVAEA